MKEKNYPKAKIKIIPNLSTKKTPSDIFTKSTDTCRMLKKIPFKSSISMDLST